MRTGDRNRSCEREVGIADANEEIGIAGANGEIGIAGANGEIGIADANRRPESPTRTGTGSGIGSKVVKRETGNEKRETTNEKRGRTRSRGKHCTGGRLGSKPDERVILQNTGCCVPVYGRRLRWPLYTKDRLTTQISILNFQLT